MVVAGDAGKKNVLNFLERHGFSVQEICEVPGERRADLRATHNAEEYLVEVKSRIADEVYFSELYATGTAERKKFLGRTNAVSAQVRDGAEQLVTTPSTPEAFRLLALIAFGDDPETQASQFQATLYGTVDVLTPGEAGSAVATPCFFFSFSEFFRLRHIDAAMIMIPGASRLCLNSFGYCLPEMRESSLTKLYAENDGLIDPSSLEAKGEAFLADCNLDRRDEAALLRYVQEKYGLQHAFTFNPNKYTAAVLVPRR